MNEQLLLFQDAKEEMLLREIKKLREQQESVRKSLYARNAQLTKMYMETKEELDTLKLAMIRSNSWVK